VTLFATPELGLLFAIREVTCKNVQVRV